MGRKRDQGKARKAARAKAKVEEKEGENNNQTTTNNGSGLEQPRAAASLLPRCMSLHGAAPFSEEDICLQFVETFILEFDEYCGRDCDVFNSLRGAHNATMDEFADVWCDPAKMEKAISYILSLGTHDILTGKYGRARLCAAIARYLEQYIAVELKKTQALYNWPKVLETYHADLHTLVKFFRHRIPCSCLDDKYEEVKDITKIGLCYNQQCNIPHGQVERRKTMYCSRCRSVTYCSRECQVAHWPMHKPFCDIDVAAKAEFDAKHQEP